MSNTIWLIIFGTLVFMAIIGYTVENNSKEKKTEKEDKTDKKEKSVKKELKKESSQKVSAETSSENTNDNEISVEVDTIPISEEPLQSPSLEQTVETVTSAGEDLTVPLEASAESTSKLDDFALNDISTLIEEPKSTTDTNDISTLIEESQPVITDTNDISALIEEPKTVATDANDISALFGEPKPEETDTNDVWKF